MSSTAYGVWRYLFLPQKQLEAALAMTTVSLAEMAGALIHPKREPQLSPALLDDARVVRDKFTDPAVAL